MLTNDTGYRNAAQGYFRALFDAGRHGDARVVAGQSFVPGTLKAPSSRATRKAWPRP